MQPFTGNGGVSIGEENSRQDEKQHTKNTLLHENVILHEGRGNMKYWILWVRFEQDTTHLEFQGYCTCPIRFSIGVACIEATEAKNIYELSSALMSS